VPAWLAAKVNLNEFLKQGVSGSTMSLWDRQFRNFLVGTEVAIAVVLLVGAGLMIRSLFRLQEVQPGFRAAKVLTTFVSLPQSRYPTGQKVANFYEQVVRNVESLPGIDRAAVVSGLPVRGDGFGMFFSVKGRTADSERPVAHYQIISPGYFSSMGIPLLKGREFLARDSDRSMPVVIVNQAIVNPFFLTRSQLAAKSLLTRWCRASRNSVPQFTGKL
jgi:hypothetical protein